MYIWKLTLNETALREKGENQYGSVIAISETESGARTYANEWDDQQSHPHNIWLNTEKSTCKIIGAAVLGVVWGSHTDMK